MAWFAGLAAVGCLIVGALHLRQLLSVPTGRGWEASSAAAAFGMAAMFSPLGDPVPTPVWIAVFGGGAAWAGVLAVRERAIGGDAGHHLLCSAAMLFMLLGHSGHGAGLGLLSIVALVAAGYFAWHGLRCVDRYRVAHEGTRHLAGAHVVTAVAMSGMLVAMI